MSWFFSSWRELIICGLTLFLLDRLPPQSIAGRIVAALSGWGIVAIIVALFLVDLKSDTVLALSTLGIGLALALLDWRSRLNVAREPQQHVKPL